MTEYYLIVAALRLQIPYSSMWREPTGVALEDQAMPYDRSPGQSVEDIIFYCCRCNIFTL